MPVLFALLPIVLPVVSKLLVDAFGKKVPSRLKPVVALAAGAAVGAGCAAAGMPVDQCAALAGLVGPGAIVANEVGQAVTGRRANASKGPDRPAPRKR